jgi:hypothetical protein
VHVIPFASQVSGALPQDSSSGTYKNTLHGLTTRVPTRILEILWVQLAIPIFSLCQKKEEKAKIYLERKLAAIVEIE